MKAHLALELVAIAAAVMAPALAMAAPSPSERAALATNAVARQPAPSARPALPEPSGIGDILKMLDGGVSKEVIKIYVENSTVAYIVSAADVIALKEHGATDDLTTALLTRGAELRARAQARAQAAAVAAAQASRGPFRLDPEGYDYFRYYYLYPRTLASAYQQLAPYAPWPYACGGYPAYGPGYGRLGRFNLP